MNELIGIDGCRKGWFCVIFDGRNFSYMLLEKLPDLFKTHATTESILIDIPIGLSTKDSPRTIDTLLRKSLIPRGSTVFNAPCRAAIYATDFNSARRINMAVEGKSLSAQTLNITSKIRETDELIRENNYRLIGIKL